MAISRDCLFVPGVWGPYLSAMVPGFWLNEGGQSATGKLFDHLLESHSASDKLRSLAEREKRHQHDVLDDILRNMASEKGVACLDFLTRVSQFTRGVEVWSKPFFLPIADPFIS